MIDQGQNQCSLLCPTATPTLALAQASVTLVAPTGTYLAGWVHDQLSGLLPTHTWKKVVLATIITADDPIQPNMLNSFERMLS